MSNIQCYNSGNYGHMKSDCWSKDEYANLTKEEEEEIEEHAEENLFMAKIF